MLLCCAVMSTCPRCGGFLGEHHRCVGLWGRRVRTVGASALAMLGGAVLGVLALYTVSGNPSGATIALGVLAGMMIGEAVRAAISH